MNLTVVFPAIPLVWIVLTMLLGLCFLTAQNKYLRGWTLSAAWCWSAVAVVCVAGSEIVIFAGGAAAKPWTAHLRFVAALCTLCPAVSQMGARRPHDRAWNFVVLSLWIVMALPAIKSYALGERFELHTTGGWFLWVLIFIGAANMLPTRFGIVALLVLGAQVILLAPQLPLLHDDFGQLGVCLAMTLAAVATGCSWRMLASCTVDLWSRDIDRLWITFRNRYGALWGLRCAERFNVSARANGWPIKLTWWGFQAAPPLTGIDDLPESTRRAALQTMKNLWRRFLPLSLLVD
jgi:hypothetical protein